MTEQEKLIARINELTQISRERELTADEVVERMKLRDEYLLGFRQSFRNQLDNTFVEDVDGEKVPLKDWHKALEEDATAAFTTKPPKEDA